MLYHVVGISFKPEISEEFRTAILDALKKLGDACGGKDEGILFFTVRDNLDQRKGIHTVEFIVFQDNKALQKFRAHPAHVDFAENFLSKGADWKVLDFFLPFPLLEEV